MHLLKAGPAVSSIALAIMQVSTANAQSTDVAPASDRRGQLEEIVVTAQKRAEALSNTAAAVSVIGQNALDNVGARNFTDAVSTLPNVSASGLGSTISIRGLGTNSITTQSNGTVAYHVDGIFQNNNQAAGQALYDIERVEVLRGPQGTLYGRNATAGVINVITSNAGREFEAFGDASYGRWNTLVLRGAVNVPLAETLAVRLTGTYENSDDWRSFANGKHPRLQDALTLRLAARADITDRLTWNTRVSYTWDNSLAPVGVPAYYYDAATQTYIKSSNRRDLASIPSVAGIDNLPFLGAPAFPSVYRGVNFEEANTRNQRFFSIRSNFNYEINDNLSLTYLFGYAHIRQKGPVVISGLQPYQVSYTRPLKSDDWSHEIDINFNADRVNGIIGLYSFENTVRSPDQVTRIFNPTLTSENYIDYNIPLLEVAAINPRDNNRTRAIFGQLTYDLTERLRLTGGARYNWDRSTFVGETQSFCPFGSGLNAYQPNVAQFAPGVPLCSTLSATGIVLSPEVSFPPGFFYVNRVFPDGEKSFEKFSWKATVDFDAAQDILLYATVATGYKAGGPGDREAIGDARFYRPETNINYEAGVRAKLFDNTLSLNLTGFWTDYKDLQVETPSPSAPGQLIAVNAGKARSRGVELEYTWVPSAADRINGYVTYLDAKFRDFPGADPITGEVRNFRGNRLPSAPEFAARIAWSHIFDLGSAGTITPTAQFLYQTESFILFTNTIPTRIPSYTRSDFIVRYETENKKFSVEGYVNNIEDKMILTQLFPAAPVANSYFTPPRSYGVRVGFRY